MKAIIASLLLVSPCALAGCRGDIDSPASHEQVEEEKNSTASSKVTEDAPKFWQDTDAAEAIELLGYNRAVVYRWQNGVVQASGYFDSEDGRERWKLNSAELLPDRFDPQRSSGVLVVAISQGESALQCEITGKVESRTASDGRSMEPTLQTQGKVEHDDNQDADEPVGPALIGFFRSSTVKGNSASLSTYIDKEWTEFLEISFSPPPKD